MAWRPMPEAAAGFIKSTGKDKPMGKGGGFARRKYTDPQLFDIYFRRFSERTARTAKSMRELPRIEICHDVESYVREIEQLKGRIERLCDANQNSVLLTDEERQELEELE